jgi:putative transposase
MSSPIAPHCCGSLAVLAEQHDEWTEQRRYLGLEILAKSRLTKITNVQPADQEVTITAITA